MTDERFSDLFQDKKGSRRELRPGDRLEAVISAISGENIFLDIGDKSEGVLSAVELRDEANQLSVQLGDKITVYLLGFRKGEMVFTTKVGSGQVTSRELEEAFQGGIPVSGRVTKEIKGGFEVTVAGQRGFCPYSQMALHRIESPDDYIDKSFSFKIIEFGQRGKNIILSARAVLEEERARQKELLRETLHESMRVRGKVTSLRPFGAFVDIGGVDGLIPLSELTWGATERVEDVLAVGQEVEVVVKQLDWKNNRISLSLRETLENPWDKIEQKYLPGSLHQGVVARLTEFGAFVTLEKGVDGLVHISKLGAGRKLRHPREVVEAGQTLTVRIESLDREKKRISLEPEDYVEHKQEKAAEREMVETWKPKSSSMGTFADLLQKKSATKK